MSKLIYIREELKKIISDLEIIRYGKQITISNKKISKELLEQIILSTPKCRDGISERIYWIINDKFEYPGCKECGKIFTSKYHGLKYGYKDAAFCSRKCLGKSVITKQKRIETHFKRTGYNHPSQNPETIQLQKNNYMAIHGVDNPLKNSEVRDLGRKTYLEKTGYSHQSHNPDVIEQTKRTNQEKFGVEHSFQSKIIKDLGRKTYLEKTGYDHPMKNPEVIKLQKDNCLAVHGVDHLSKSLEFQEQKKIKHMNLHGVEFPTQMDEFIEQVKQTNLERRGVSCALKCPIVIEKGRQTNLEKTGYDHPSKNPEIIQARKNNYMNLHGVDHHMKRAEVAEKCLENSHKTKKMQLPSGKEINYQGYEDVAIKELLKTLSEEEVILSRLDIPEIFYTSKNSRYYPDIYIPSRNLIIEVKSLYTYTVDLEKNLLKEKACFDAGYDFQFWICSKKEVLEIKKGTLEFPKM